MNPLRVCFTDSQPQPSVIAIGTIPACFEAQRLPRGEWCYGIGFTFLRPTLIGFHGVLSRLVALLPHPRTVRVTFFGTLVSTHLDTIEFNGLETTRLLTKGAISGKGLYYLFQMRPKTDVRHHRWRPGCFDPWIWAFVRFLGKLQWLPNAQMSYNGVDEFQYGA